MKFSISNIAWGAEHDAEMYGFLQSEGIEGLEIAPTRIFPDEPYRHASEARDWAAALNETYGLAISSMQSIWYGRAEKIFDGKQDRQTLIDYTKQAILFAEAIGCRNLVFGCPKNRDTDDVARDVPIAIEFFRAIGDFAAEHGTTVALEPNPVIYNTRFMNTTAEALDMICRVNVEGIKLNADLGAMIHNNEDMSILSAAAGQINHVHISEPGLKAIEMRPLHKTLHSLLKKAGYDKFVSIEMGNNSDLSVAKQSVRYVKSIGCA